MKMVAVLGSPDEFEMVRSDWFPVENNTPRTFISAGVLFIRCSDQNDIAGYVLDGLFTAFRTRRPGQGELIDYARQRLRNKN